MKNELRLTDTNAASDSKGKTWGLDGGLFWWLVGGVGASVMVFFVFLVVRKSSLSTSGIAAALPMALSLAYIFGLRQGKPPGYDRDCFEYILSARGFGPDTDCVRVPIHPLYEPGITDIRIRERNTPAGQSPAEPVIQTATN
jgi:hypothetical protein